MKKQDDLIPLTKEQKANAAALIRAYIAENFDAEIGNLQAGIFVDYITKNFGVYYYNKAIADASAYMTERAEDMYMLIKDEE